MTRTPQIDGGRRALAGFLYQILGIGGLRASVQASEADGRDELDALVTLVRNGRIEHEGFDQDAVIRSVVRGEKGVSFVQFKHSGIVPPRILYRDEYDDIVAKLAKSEEGAEAQGLSVTGYYLLTNREVRNSSESIFPAVEGGATSPTTKSAKPSRRSNRPSPGVTGSKPPCKISPREEKIRGRLVVQSDLPTDAWLSRLRRLAATLGCVDNEIDDGIAQLVGRVVVDTVAGIPFDVDLSDLFEAFADCRTMRALTAEHRVAKSLDRIGKLADLLHPGRPVRRKLLDELDGKIRERALVVLEGPGGSGKSTALVDWAGRLVESPSPRPGALTSVFPSSDVRPRLITEIVCDWFELPPVHHVRRNDPAELALDRLETAAPGEAHPVLIVGLDGIDEGARLADRLPTIRETLRWFWEEDRNAQKEGRPPRAAVVVTSRRGDLLNTYLDLDIAGYPSDARSPDAIDVGDFNDSELLMAAHQDLGWAYRRIRGTLERLGRLPDYDAEYGMIPPTAEGASECEPPVDLDILESVRHPAMWRALIELGEEVGSRVLDGDPEAGALLASSFTERWFCRKARRRRFDQLSAAEIVAILGSVARASRGRGEVLGYQPDWQAPASSSVDATTASALYHEAISAGYIDEVSKFRWRWRHRLCVDYLLSTASPE